MENNKKLVLIASIIVVLFIAVVIALYAIFIQQKKVASVPSQKITEEEFVPQTLNREDFIISIPSGWENVEGLPGSMLFVRNMKEQPQGESHGFRSYFSVAKEEKGDSFPGGFLFKLRENIRKIVPGIEYGKENIIPVGSREGIAFDGIADQNGVRFKVLVVVLRGKGNDVWVLTFNSLESRWEENSKIFTNIINSFHLK